MLSGLHGVRYGWVKSGRCGQEIEARRDAAPFSLSTINYQLSTVNFLHELAHHAADGVGVNQKCVVAVGFVEKKQARAGDEAGEFLLLLFGIEHVRVDGENLDRHCQRRERGFV